MAEVTSSMNQPALQNLQLTNGLLRGDGEHEGRHIALEVADAVRVRPAQQVPSC